jgi:hypothetical protein
MKLEFNGSTITKKPSCIIENHMRLVFDAIPNGRKDMMFDETVTSS